MRMKLRDVRSGFNFDTSYRPEEKFEQAIVKTIPAQYLYQWMIRILHEHWNIWPIWNPSSQRSKLEFILENSDVNQFYRTEVISVQVPTTVDQYLLKHNHQSKVQQLQVQVNLQHLKLVLWLTIPDFIEAGQRLVINTAEGTYVSRAKPTKSFTGLKAFISN